MGGVLRAFSSRERIFLRILCIFPARLDGVVGEGGPFSRCTVPVANLSEVLSEGSQKLKKETTPATIFPDANPLNHLNRFKHTKNVVHNNVSLILRYIQNAQNARGQAFSPAGKNSIVNPH